MANAYILVVDDEPDIRNLLKEILEDEGYDVGVAENGISARAARKQRRPDLILLDIWMPDVDGISLLKEWTESESQPVPVIMMSGHGTVETAVEATRLGAYDFIEKPLSLGKLLITVRRALEAWRMQQENQDLRRQSLPDNELIGRSAAMEELREQLRRVAQHNTTVLLQGEPGSGKGAAAHFLHEHSDRADSPLIEVSLAALSGASAVTELFGQEEGDQVQYGLFEQANGGTLLLDDIADLEPDTQGRLLGVLESGKVVRTGGNELVPINVRVAVSTQHDLQRLVAEGRFRKDLLYHLNVVPISIPPLREHPEDIPELVNYYVGYFVDQERLPYRPFTVAAQNRLRQYTWPGNVRELQNLVQRLLIIGGGHEIDVEEVETALGQDNPETRPGAVLASPATFNLPLRQARERFEKAYFERLLKEMDGSMVKVAQAAGIERTHLYRKLRALDIDSKSGGRR